MMQIAIAMRMVNDLNETQNKKTQKYILKSKSLDNFIDTSTHLLNHSTDVTSSTSTFLY